MRIDNVKRPETSFLSVEKDMGTIVTEIFKNERLKRLLYYNTKDALNRPNIDDSPKFRYPLKREHPFNGSVEWFYPNSILDDTEAEAEFKKRIGDGWQPISPTASLFRKNIKIVPKVKVEREVDTYIVVTFDNFIGNATNPEFRDNVISFDICCNFEYWDLGDFKLRPYRIAAELDGMLNGKHLSGIGTLEFLGANQIVLNDDFGGLSLHFLAIHGEDDKVPHPDDPDFIQEEFEEMFKE